MLFEWLWRRLDVKKPQSSDDKVQELWPAFRHGKASFLQKPLESAIKSGVDVSLEALLLRARSEKWASFELEKLKAYYFLFSGDAAAGYRHILSGRLAAEDYPLFITASVHCYLYDRFDEAYALLKQFDPESAENVEWAEFLAYAGYIAFCGGRGEYEESLGYFDRAIDSGLISPLLVVNAYPVYFEAGRHERCDQLRRIIHERYSGDPEAIYALACGELARGYYAEGFRLAEARYRMPEVARAINPVLLQRPRWQGDAVEGKRLLVHGEQGLGDVVMMARYLPLLAERGARVVVDCRDEAVSLLQSNFPVCDVVSGGATKATAAEFDLWTGAMSLPWHFGTTAESVPFREGYLSVPDEQRAYWRGRIKDVAGEGRLRVGLAWSGNPSHRADRRRSISAEQIFPRLSAIQGAQFFALQTVVPSVRPQNLFAFTDEMLTLADTAALLDQMDLVITVDTSIVHLAGALGKPAWLLLPKRYEWRWGLDGVTNNWYSSVMVLRQTKHGIWTDLLDDVFARRLPEYMAAANPLSEE